MFDLNGEDLKRLSEALNGQQLSGSELLLGIYEMQKKAAEAPWAIKEHDLPKGFWRRVINPDGEAFCNIITDNYVIGVKTGRVIFFDKKTKKRLPPVMGFHNLVTGDVKYDESELAVLQQGNHFYVLSLKTFEVTHKVTLPRGFVASDVYCTYSDDGRKLFVPIQKYDNSAGKYRFFLCEYETEGYTLTSRTEISYGEVDKWSNSK